MFFQESGCTAQKKDPYLQLKLLVGVIIFRSRATDSGYWRTPSPLLLTIIFRVGFAVKRRAAARGVLVIASLQSLRAMRCNAERIGRVQ
jgi:hypothetical protein